LVNVLSVALADTCDTLWSGVKTLGVTGGWCAHFLLFKSAMIGVFRGCRIAASALAVVAFVLLLPSLERRRVSNYRILPDFVR
jgi:hypothetical protein